MLLVMCVTEERKQKDYIYICASAIEYLDL